MNGPTKRDYRLVRVGKNEVGLVGLTEIFEALKGKRQEPDALLGEMLVEEAQKKNYIPREAREDYKRGLLREFRKFLGEAVQEERREVLEVTILGPGCPSCNRLEQEVMSVLSEMGCAADLKHVTAPEAVVHYGIFATPALVINGKVRSKGTIPSRSMIRAWLEEEWG